MLFLSSEITREVKTIQEKYQELKDSAGDLSSRQDQLRLQGATRQEKLSKLSFQHQQKLKMNQENIDQLQG